MLTRKRSTKTFTIDLTPQFLRESCTAQGSAACCVHATAATCRHNAGLAVDGVIVPGVLSPFRYDLLGVRPDLN